MPLAAGLAFETPGTSLLAAEAYLAAARRAAQPATICGDIRTPGLSPGTGTGRLTRREREVAG